MNRKTCPDCKARSYSSYNGPDWICPICGKNLSEVPNDHDMWSHLGRVLEYDQIQKQVMVGQKNLMPRTRL
ncbi:MAG: hypothetical protein P4L69_21050 [Desulfosporosinus sp.]|nr:hypothetical protein [Desulfosporosinus sp.]